LSSWSTTDLMRHLESPAQIWLRITRYGCESNFALGPCIRLLAGVLHKRRIPFKCLLLPSNAKPHRFCLCNPLQLAVWADVESFVREGTHRESGRCPHSMRRLATHTARPCGIKSVPSSQRLRKWSSINRGRFSAADELKVNNVVLKSQVDQLP